MIRTRIPTLIFTAIVLSSFGLESGFSKQLPDEPVRPTITLNKRNIEFVEGPSCWFGNKSEEGICADPPHPITFNTKIKENAVAANAGGAIRITFPIMPDELTLTVVNADGSEISIDNPGQYNYKLPKRPGYYDYRLSAVWGVKNTAAYYFGVYINE